MKGIIISIIIALALVGVTAWLVPKGSGNPDSSTVNSNNNVSIVEGKQIIELQTKGGYQPRKSVAKAGIPTVIRFKTNGTFDCSASVRIPSLNVSKFLPQTGNTDIDIGSPEIGLFRGSCGMGMYPFEIDFRV